MCFLNSITYKLRMVIRLIRYLQEYSIMLFCFCYSGCLLLYIPLNQHNPCFTLTIFDITVLDVQQPYNFYLDFKNARCVYLNNYLLKLIGSFWMDFVFLIYAIIRSVINVYVVERTVKTQKKFRLGLTLIVSKEKDCL